MPTDRPPVPPEGSDTPQQPTPLVFCDTNVFLRYLTNDVPEQADRVDELLACAEAGQVRLTTSVLVMAEMLWTLRTFYGQSKDQVRDAVLALCHTPGLAVEDADGLVQAAEWHAEKNVDFAGAYHVVRARALGADSVATFNQEHFRRFEGLTLADL